MGKAIPPVTECLGPECDKPSKARGMCFGHYRQSVKGKDLYPLNSRSRRPITSTIRDEHGNKRCSVCREWLPVGSFTRRAFASDGLCGACRRCARDWLMQKKYSLDSEKFEAMLADQGGVCLICDQTPPSGEWWATDHDHSCCPGKETCGACVRGILCSKCNLMLGFYESVPDFIQRMDDYLLKWGERDKRQ